MTTIRLPDPDETSGELERIFEVIRRREEKIFGVRRISNVWLAQAHHPRYLQCNWERSRAVMQRQLNSIPSPASRSTILNTRWRFTISSRRLARVLCSLFRLLSGGLRNPGRGN